MRNLRNSMYKCIRSFGYAFNGIGYLIKNENNIRYQLAVGVVTVSLGIYMEVSYFEWLILITMIGLVLMAEAFNTAIEKLCDIVHPDHHAQIGMVKDIAAGAVLLIAIAAVILGIVIFGSKLLEYIS
jgi:diacylglycerol kinase (ATP)